MTREGVFECTYASSDQQWTAHVLAWDAREALELFASELREAGVADRGEISARARRDGTSSTSAYPLA